jgi:hypothetical protein
MNDEIHDQSEAHRSGASMVELVRLVRLYRVNKFELVSAVKAMVHIRAVYAFVFQKILSATLPRTQGQFAAHKCRKHGCRPGPSPLYSKSVLQYGGLNE